MCILCCVEVVGVPFDVLFSCSHCLQTWCLVLDTSEDRARGEWGEEKRKEEGGGR